MDYEHVAALEKIAKEAKKAHVERTNPERIYATLMNIIDGYTENCMHSADMGFLRNDGIVEICTQLNNLQKELRFQTPYEVKCELTKKP